MSQSSIQRMGQRMRHQGVGDSRVGGVVRVLQMSIRGSSTAGGLSLVDFRVLFCMFNRSET